MDVLKGKKVLIADGDADSLRERVDFLRSAGCEALAVGSGAECLDRAAREKPAVILIDVSLTDQDAHLVCAKLKEMSGNFHVILLIPDDNPTEQHFGKFVNADAVFDHSAWPSKIIGCVAKMSDSP